MQTTFSENLRALRRQRHLTQEQLAEAMGVSAGAIYKWEQELSTPDIRTIMELAGFFGLTVDALVGFRANADDRERILEALSRIRREKSYEDHWDEVERWVRRYPNDFDIHYAAGTLYHLAGTENHRDELLLRSISLLEHACALIRPDSPVRRDEICQLLGVSYLELGQNEKGLALLKAHNPCGMNDDLIGLELSEHPFCPREAREWLGKSLIGCTVRLQHTADGLLNVLRREKNYPEMIGLLMWLLSFLEGLVLPGKISFLQKDLAVLTAECAALHALTGESEIARQLLQRACRCALSFDDAPDYSTRNVRYCEATALQSCDSSGPTALEAVRCVLRDYIPICPQLADLWKEVCHEP